MDALTIVIGFIVLLICYFIPLRWLKKNPLKSTLVGYIPTFCTSVGVFFSFLLLWIVLANFNLGNDLGVIVRLLAGKFLFSVIGIATGIGWSIYIRHKLTQEEMQEINKPYMTKDPQELLWELVGLQDENNEMTKKILKAQYETELTVKNTKDKMVDGLANVTSAVVSTHQQQLQKLDALLGAMTSAGDYMREHLGRMINDLKASLEAYIKIMGDQAITITKEQAILINKEFVKLVAELRTNMTTELTNSQKLADNIIKTFEDSIKDNTDKALEQQQKMANDFKTNSETQINNLKASYDKIEEKLGAISANIEQEIGEILKNNTENLSQTFEKLGELQQRSQTALETSSNAFKEAVDQFKDAVQGNKAIAEQLKEQLILLQQLLEETRLLYDKWSLQGEEMEQMQERTNVIANMTDNIDQLLRTLQQSANHQ